MKSFLIFCAIALIFDAHSQLSPANDPNWQRQTAVSDEFTTTTLSSPVWGTGPLFGITDIPMDPSNVILNGNTMKLVLTGATPIMPPSQLNPNCNWNAIESSINWKGAGVCTYTQYPYHFGYYEIRMKFPYYTNGNGNPTCQGVIPQFWLSSERWCNDPSGLPTCDEIDIIEGSGYTNINPVLISSHWHGNKNCNDPNPANQCKAGDVLLDFDTETQVGPEAWHKIGCEYLPDRIAFYFDDVPYGVIIQPTVQPTSTVSVWIDLAFSHTCKNYAPCDPICIQNCAACNVNNPPPNCCWQCCPPSTLGLLDPVAPLGTSPLNTGIFWEIDYFRYFTLSTITCNTDINILNNSDLSNYPGGVYRNVNVGVTGTETVYMTSTTPLVIRHSKDFTVICDFEVPLLADLTIINTKCH
jgi:hypothetical protein